MSLIRQPFYDIPDFKEVVRSMSLQKSIGIALGLQYARFIDKPIVILNLKDKFRVLVQQVYQNKETIQSRSSNLFNLDHFQKGSNFFQILLENTKTRAQSIQWSQLWIFKEETAEGINSLLTSIITFQSNGQILMDSQHHVGSQYLDTVLTNLSKSLDLNFRVYLQIDGSYRCKWYSYNKQEKQLVVTIGINSYEEYFVPIHYKEKQLDDNASNIHIDLDSLPFQCIAQDYMQDSFAQQAQNQNSSGQAQALPKLDVVALEQFINQTEQDQNSDQIIQAIKILIQTHPAYATILINSQGNEETFQQSQDQTQIEQNPHFCAEHSQHKSYQFHDCSQSHCIDCLYEISFDENRLPLDTCLCEHRKKITRRIQSQIFRQKFNKSMEIYLQVGNVQPQQETNQGHVNEVPNGYHPDKSQAQNYQGSQQKTPSNQNLLTNQIFDSPHLSQINTQQNHNEEQKDQIPHISNIISSYIQKKIPKYLRNQIILDLSLQQHSNKIQYLDQNQQNQAYIPPEIQICRTCQIGKQNDKFALITHKCDICNECRVEAFQQTWNNNCPNPICNTLYNSQDIQKIISHMVHEKQTDPQLIQRLTELILQHQSHSNNQALPNNAIPPINLQGNQENFEQLQEQALNLPNSNFCNIHQQQKSYQFNGCSQNHCTQCLYEISFDENGKPVNIGFCEHQKKITKKIYSQIYQNIHSRGICINVKDRHVQLQQEINQGQQTQNIQRPNQANYGNQSKMPSGFQPSLVQTCHQQNLQRSTTQNQIQYPFPIYNQQNHHVKEQQELPQGGRVPKKIDLIDGQIVSAPPYYYHANQQHGIEQNILSQPPVPRVPQPCRICQIGKEKNEFALFSHKCDVCNECRVKRYLQTGDINCPNRNCYTMYGDNDCNMLQILAQIEPQKYGSIQRARPQEQGETKYCSSCPFLKHQNDIRKCSNNRCQSCTMCIQQNGRGCQCGGTFQQEVQTPQQNQGGGSNYDQGIPPLRPAQLPQAVGNCMNPGCKLSEDKPGRLLACGHWAHFGCISLGKCPSCDVIQIQNQFQLRYFIWLFQYIKDNI